MSTDPIRQWSPLAGMLCAAALSVGCGDGAAAGADDQIDFDPDRPATPVQQSVEPYTGDNDYVLEAQERFRTPVDLHRKVIFRTCSPTGGVCHNQKEYPDLHTVANFMNTLGAPCNVQPGEWESVYDGCEEPGDRFKIDGVDMRETEIGYLERVPGEYVEFEDDQSPDADSAGLHIYLHDPVELRRDRTNTWGTARFIRTFVNEDQQVEDLPFATFRTRWWVLDDGRHIFAEVKDYQVDQVNELLSVGIVQGDMNRNGTYGARESAPAQMLHPGEPESSYLIARLRGSMHGEEIPGSRMPLANQPLSISEMLGLFCFVEGASPEDANRDGSTPIDYANCSYSQAPEELDLLGEGVTWSGRVQKILEANCGGCHGGASPAAGLNVRAEDAYTRLLGPSTQMPEMNLIEPGSPEESYLWLKLTGDEAITGQSMPINPIDGEGQLPEAALSDINTWIVNGALDE